MKKGIPLFDTLSHPTIDGNWILPRYANTSNMDVLLDQMRSNNVRWSFAVGMEGIGSYEEDEFINFVQKKSDGALLPIAFFSFSNKSRNELSQRLASIKSKGYVGIKLHPRIGQFMMDDENLPFVIDKANELGLVVLLCTYFYSNKQSTKVNNVDMLGDMLLHVKESSKVVLLHGGGVRLLETMEIVRAFPNTILDLSLTLCKYAGSSLDLDIQFLFQQFDRRVCVGSDFPEISLTMLRDRFEHFSESISLEKAENIAYKNILSFAGLNE